MTAETYADVYSFLRLHTEVAELVDAEGGGRVLVAPACAARVMTSTADGVKGSSLGWVNRPAFTGPRDPHFTNFGGEERLWLGPEGGQFSLYHAPGGPFDLEDWYVPAAFNDEPFAVTERDDHAIVTCKAMGLRNWSATAFSILVERAIRVIPRGQVGALLGVALPDDVGVAAFATENAIINQATIALRKDTGLLSIWMLNMLNATPRTAVIIPFRTDAQGGSGRIVKDDYFGAVPPDRLVLKDSFLVFKGDAQHRGKIGLSPARATDRLGSLDLLNNVLTVVQFSFSGGGDYVNSAWELQQEPYRGDVINSYNDGPPPGGGKPLGAFFELETSSPAAELAPGEKLAHVQKTFHIKGSAAAIDAIARSVLGAGIAEATLVLGR
jgi:hypothetical protein